jgi:Family of unknown function (DUF5330)
MFFLLRMAFWLCVVCVLLSFGSQSSDPQTQIDAKQAVTLASAAVTDARGFCDRQPDACQVGGSLVVALGHKAEAGARTLYQFISAKLNEPSEPAGKSGTTAAKVVPVSGAGNGSLTPSDMQPAWHAPVPLPPRREARASRPSA